MKRKLLKSLLLTAIMLVGSTCLWADEVVITETYDFGAFITANGAPNLTITGDDIPQTGTSAKVGAVKVIDNLTNNGQTLNLNGRFAVDYPYNAGSQIRFIWRSSGNAYQHGLAGNWNSKGSADPQGAARFSVLNLKAGDKITFTYAKQSGKAADPYTCSASQLTGIGVDADLTSGTQYTVAADGNVDLYFTNNNFAVSKIVIVTTGTETVSAPSIAVTGCDAKARKVTITAGTSDAGNDVVTYYTTDGSTPTTSSASFTTASQEITIGESATVESTVTVKAFSVSSLKTESSEASLDVTVGTLVQLSAPEINLSSFSASGLLFNPTYTFTSNQSGVFGNPAVNYTYSFAGGESTAGTSYTAITSGSITVTVSAEGYASNSTVQSIVGGSYAKTYSFDAITEVSRNDGIEWGSGGNASSVNGAGWSYAALNQVTYTLRSDITLAGGFSYARATTKDTNQGFYTRTGAGTIGFTLNDGEFIMFSLLDGQIVANSAANSQAFGQWVNVRAIDIYTPATEVDLAILDCKRYETSTAFATAVAAESFSTAAEVYAFHTAWQIAQAKAAGSVDITKVIRNAAIADGTDWAASNVLSGEQFTGAPDNTYLDIYNTSMNTNQTIYGVPAGTYKIKAATRAATGTPGTLYVNDGSGDIANISQITNVGNTGGDLGNGWSYQEMTFTLTEPKDLLIGFWTNASGSKWAGCDDWHMEIAGVPVTLGSLGWATLYTPYALNFDGTGLTAYTATLSEGIVTLTEVITDVPANTGVVLSGDAGSYNIPTIASSETSKGDLTGNATESTAYNAVANHTYYVLAPSEDSSFKVQFRPVESGSIAAGKAFLDVAGAGVKAFSVKFADADAIRSIENESSMFNVESSKVYNLAGQRMSKLQKGINIVNGKKVLVQ